MPIKDPTGSSEKKEPIIEHAYEYRNAIGEKICDVKYTIDEHHEMTSCELVGLDGKAVNVFEVCALPSDVKVKMGEASLTQSYFSRKRKGQPNAYVVIHELDSVSRFGIFLHEAGHSKQDEDVYHDDGFSLYDAWMQKSGDIDIAESLVAIMKRFDFGSYVFSQGDIQWIERIVEEYAPFKQRNKALLHELKIKRTRREVVEKSIAAMRGSSPASVLALRNDLSHDLHVLSEEWNTNYRKMCEYFTRWSDFEKKFRSEIDRIKKVPRIYFERDANSFALQKLRVLREKFGIDLLQCIEKTANDKQQEAHIAAVIKKNDPDFAAVWEAECAGIQTMSDRLTVALRTYEGDNPAVHKTYGKPPRPRRGV